MGTSSATLANRKLQQQCEEYAGQEAQKIIEAIAARPDDLEGHRRLLHDLKLTVCQQAAAHAVVKPDGEIVWGLANELPDFDAASLYRARSSFLSLAVAVLIGWLLGGLIATLLGFIGLGGEILRPAAILATLWLEEYLGVNPKARRVMLTVLGLGALGRFATSLAQGMVRLSGAGGIGRLIFGAGTRPNIFKTAWLWFGAIFLYIFFAKKITGLDVTVFRHSLQEQIVQRLNLATFFFAETEKSSPVELPLAASDGKCVNPHCAIAEAALALLDSLDEDKRKYLAGSLRQAGYIIDDADQDYLVWNQQQHAEQYEPLGLVRNGDRCRILARPHRSGSSFRKGSVQRVSS